ncbi:MAG TPA: alpha/beta fold hydrolase [Blastocatellia bacterium]|nr:alpha/beta fold hydrolase [Blastocatellia bacterium]
MDRTPFVAQAILGALLLVVTASCSQTSGIPAAANAPSSPQPSPATKGAPERVTFTTDDDDSVAIVGDLYLPEQTPAPAILALHQFQSNRASYATFATAMRDAGFVVLAIDGRGFGESTRGSHGSIPPGWSTQRDIAAAVEFLKSRTAVDATRIGLIGASYGASNALIYAADHPTVIRSTVLLSVGLNYHGSLPTEPAIAKYGDRPLLMIAARDDVDDGPQTAALAATVHNPRYKVQVYDKGGHGTSLLGPGVGGLDAVRSFFIETLSVTGAAPSGAADSTNRAGEPTAREGNAKP